MQFETVLLDYLTALEKIKRLHLELSDSEPREQIAETLHYYFVWDQPLDRLPCKYGMFNRAANQAVAGITNEFLKRARSISRQAGLNTPQARFDALQSPLVKTLSGRTGDDFFGWAPELFPMERLMISRFEQE